MELEERGRMEERGRIDERYRMEVLLKEAVMVLCKNGLSYQSGSNGERSAGSHGGR